MQPYTHFTQHINVDNERDSSPKIQRMSNVVIMVKVEAWPLVLGDKLHSLLDQSPICDFIMLIYLIVYLVS